MRRAKDFLIRAVIPIAIVSLFVGTVMVVPTGASADPGLRCCGGGGGGPVYDIIYLTDFGGDLAVYLNNSLISNGGALVLQASVAVPLKIDTTCPGSSYFMEWVTDIGTIGSPSSCSTTFTPASGGGGGVLMPVLNGSQIESTSKVPANFYGGYIDFPTSVSVTFDFTCVSGTVTVPTISVPSDQLSGTNELSVWVGIGGVAGNSSLWQAGMFITQTVSGPDTNSNWYPFYDTATKSNPYQTVELSPSSTNFPSSMTVSVCAPSTGLDTYYLDFYEPDQDRYISWSGTLSSPFFPNTETADWIAENPVPSGSGSSHSSLPDFSPMTWSDPTWTNQNGTGLDFLDSFGSFAIDDTSCSCGTQFVNPSSLAASDTQFIDTYST